LPNKLIEECYRNKHQVTYPWEQSKPTNRFFSDIKTILVVGASGFLGTRLVEKLSLGMGVAVRAAIHRPGTAARLARFPVQFAECDVLDPQQVAPMLHATHITKSCNQDITIASCRPGFAGYDGSD
jgi:hypothetical protein